MMRSTFKRVKRRLQPGEVVCAVYDTEGKPHYFAADKEASPEEMTVAAFKQLHAREPNNLERRFGRIRDNVPMSDNAS